MNKRHRLHETGQHKIYRRAARSAYKKGRMAVIKQVFPIEGPRIRRRMGRIWRYPPSGGAK